MSVTVATAQEVAELRREVEQLRADHQATAQAEAEAVMLAVVYRIAGEPDPLVPFGGLLTSRLQLSERCLREAISGGRLGYFLGAKKAYRIPEPAVRRFVAGLPPLAA